MSWGWSRIPYQNFLEQNWLVLSKFGWIWAKIGKIKAKFGQG